MGQLEDPFSAASSIGITENSNATGVHYALLLWKSNSSPFATQSPLYSSHSASSGVQYCCLLPPTPRRLRAAGQPRRAITPASPPIMPRPPADQAWQILP